VTASFQCFWGLSVLCRLEFELQNFEPKSYLVKLKVLNLSKLEDYKKLAVASPVLNIFANHTVVYEVCPRIKVVNLYVQIILKRFRGFL